MNPIDLLSYSEHQCKISRDKLMPAKVSPPIALWKILAAFFVDSWLVWIVTLMGHSVFSQALTGFVFNQKLIKLMDQSFLIPFKVYPLVLISYFFVSYFFNHGQSLGQFLFKLRLVVPEKNFPSALRASLICTGICLSGGLLVFWSKSKYQVVAHDYLYVDLIRHKDFSPINLIEQTRLNDGKIKKQEFLPDEKMAA